MCQLPSERMKVDTDELIDSVGVAAILGLANYRAVSVYRARYDDFPEPVLVTGRCLLWRRPDVEAWARATGRLENGG